jgi:CHAT domain-containing protein
LFAGANAAWKNDSLPPDMDDGILTSLEISQMYLPTTKLVVVSACETGLGDIKGDEGVYGIQRAFKMAGANFLVLSLWPVPDRETSELMQEFYRRWLSGKPIQEAFRLAQNQIKKKYRDEPSKWAAFVLIN